MMDIEALKKNLQPKKKILITSHRNPDGDAIGASLALKFLLEASQHEVVVALPSEYPEYFSWLPDAEKILIYDKTKDAVEQAVAQAELFFCLDFNTLDRIDKIGDAMLLNNNPKVLIDHHLNPGDFADFVLSDTSASSTSELIFQFIEMFSLEHLMNPIIAECMLTGIITDTGSFKFSTSPKLFRTVAKLVEYGADISALQNLIFNSLTEKQVRILGYCLYRRFEVLEDINVGIITLSKFDFENYQIGRGDTEGIVNQILAIRKLNVAVFITQQPNIVKLSLRSKADINVEVIMRNHFNGGGHKNAAGGYSHSGLRNTVNKLKELLPQYLVPKNDISTNFA
ncbi:MAG: bifunctional oligoribonuclease/PAP phosphatase NrnA [Saprospiraceae bacterium]